MSFDFFIAKRIFSSGGEGSRYSRPAVVIASAGIVIGLAVMIISLCVVLGFKHEVSSKVIGFGSDIQVLSMTQNQYGEMLPVLTTDSLEKEIRSVGGVRHVQRFATKMGMLKTDEDFKGITLKGVESDYDMTFLRSYLKEGDIPDFSKEESNSEILISKRVASDLGLKAGDKVFAYFIGNNSNIRARRFKITGIFETNLTEYDKAFAYTSIHTVRKLNNWESNMSSGFEIFINDESRLQVITSKLISKVNHNTDENGTTYGAFSIREVYPQIFSWLDVLDTNVIMILVLMFCVSAFTIISGILIVMLERINMIGLLGALGATNFVIRKIFMNFSIMLLGKAVILGNVIGFTLCLLQKYFRVVKLDASVYYIDAVPIKFDPISLIAVNVGVILLSSIIIFGSSFLMSISKPSTTMRFE